MANQYTTGSKERIPLAVRFLKYVGRKTKNGCILWTGYTNGFGYGSIWSAEAGKPVSAHCVSYAFFIGPIDGQCVLHKCDNPPCVNPAHLFLGSRAENMFDKVAKGRQHKGERTGGAKLTEKAVKEIRRRFAAGESQASIAKYFAISPSSISRIVHRHDWKHVK